MQKSQTPARMARLVAQWQRSGESAVGFARNVAFRPGPFWYWRRRLARASTDPARTAAAPTFVPVQVASDADAWMLEVAFHGGERLQVRVGASAELVRAAVAASRTGCGRDPALSNNPWSEETGQVNPTSSPPKAGPRRSADPRQTTAATDRATRVVRSDRTAAVKNGIRRTDTFHPYGYAREFAPISRPVSPQNH